MNIPHFKIAFIAGAIFLLLRQLLLLKLTTSSLNMRTLKSKQRQSMRTFVLNAMQNM